MDVIAPIIHNLEPAIIAIGPRQAGHGYGTQADTIGTPWEGMHLDTNPTYPATEIQKHTIGK